MDLRFTYTQKCSLCLKKFKTLRSVQKHAEQKHSAEADRAYNVVFLDNEEKEVALPAIKAMDRRSQDYKLGYLEWLAGLTEQINASLNPHLRGGWVTLQITQVPEKYFGHLAHQTACEVHSMRQVSHKKPPFYCPSTKRIPYKVYCLAAFTDALHEQTFLQLKDTIWYCGQEEVDNRSDLSALEELHAAKNRSFWRAAGSKEESGSTVAKRATTKANIEVGPGQGRITREIELIWWPDLYRTTNNGKLGIRFFIKKVNV